MGLFAGLNKKVTNNIEGIDASLATNGQVYTADGAGDAGFVNPATPVFPVTGIDIPVQDDIDKKHKIKGPATGTNGKVHTLKDEDGVLAHEAVTAQHVLDADYTVTFAGGAALSVEVPETGIYKIELVAVGENDDAAFAFSGAPTAYMTLTQANDQATGTMHMQWIDNTTISAGVRIYADGASPSYQSGNDIAWMSTTDDNNFYAGKGSEYQSRIACLEGETDVELFLKLTDDIAPETAFFKLRTGSMLRLTKIADWPA